MATVSDSLKIITGDIERACIYIYMNKTPYTENHNQYVEGQKK